MYASVHIGRGCTLLQFGFITGSLDSDDEEEFHKTERELELAIFNKRGDLMQYFTIVVPDVTDRKVTVTGICATSDGLYMTDFASAPGNLLFIPAVG